MLKRFSERRIERYGEDYERPKYIDTSDFFLFLPYLLLLAGCVALGLFLRGQ